MSVADTIRANLDRTRERIALAAERAGRDPETIKLVGVTKYVDAATTAALVDAGCNALGESRPQQLWAKAEAAGLAGRPIEWHMIGHLQRNKTARTVALRPLIHGIDNFRTLGAVNKAAETGDFVAEVLLEVNCSGDETKHGVAPDQLPHDIEDLNYFLNIRVRGLMTMAARGGGERVARENFALLRELRDKCQPLAPAGTTLDELSMGMSGDFEQAIAEGATIVRIGSALWEGVGEP